MSERWTGLSPAQTTISCGEHTHTLRWDQGALTAVDHGDPEDEAILAALAGRTVPCLDILSAWQHVREDPRVLTIGSRGATDVVSIHDDIRQGHAARNPGPGGELLTLLALGGGLPDRLIAEAAATWTDRLKTGHPTLEPNHARLHAALYGRLLLTVRQWLTEPELSLQLTLSEALVERPLTRDGDVINATLPFGWIENVWSRGLAVIFGRLTLSAQTNDGAEWTLTTLAPDLAHTEQLEIRARPADRRTPRDEPQRE